MLLFFFRFVPEIGFRSYFNFNKINHSICGAHILRELEGLAESGQSKWAKVFKEKPEPPPTKVQGKRGRYKRTKGRNLVERLIREQNAVLAFAFNKEVPFTNNLAERDIRPAKIKQKISNCFRTFTGAEIYARIEGFVSSARKHNQNIFSELCTTFEEHNFITV